MADGENPVTGRPSPAVGAEHPYVIEEGRSHQVTEKPENIAANRALFWRTRMSKRSEFQSLKSAVSSGSLVTQMEPESISRMNI